MSPTPTRPIRSRGRSPPPSASCTMPNNRPTICTADEQNCVSITSRVHWDVGGYDYRPNTAATSAATRQRRKPPSRAHRRDRKILRRLELRADLRFRRLFGRLWRHRPAPAARRSASCRAARVSGVENAYLSYTGFKPFGGKLAIEGGIMDMPYTLDEVHEFERHPVHGTRFVRHHRAEHRRRRLPLHRRRALVQRPVLGRRLCHRARPPAPSTPPRASTPTARRNNTARSPAPPARSSAATTTRFHLGGESRMADPAAARSRSRARRR